MGDPHFHFCGKLMIRESPFLFNFKLLNHTSFGTDPKFVKHILKQEEDGQENKRKL